MIFFSKLFFIFLISSTQLLSEDLINDERFYNNGVKLYDEGNFKESFIVFFNLSENTKRVVYFEFRDILGELLNSKQSLEECYREYKLIN